MIKVVLKCVYRFDRLNYIVWLVFNVEVIKMNVICVIFDDVMVFNYNLVGMVFVWGEGLCVWD